jgi:hypothetical protein
MNETQKFYLDYTQIVVVLAMIELIGLVSMYYDSVRAGFEMMILVIALLITVCVYKSNVAPREDL